MSSQSHETEVDTSKSREPKYRPLVLSRHLVYLYITLFSQECSKDIFIIINHFIHSHMHKSSYDNGIEDIKLYIQFLL